MAKQILHECKSSDLAGDSVSEKNESLFQMYLGIAFCNGGKILYLISGTQVAKMLAVLPDFFGEIQDAPFYRLGAHSIIPIYVDASLGEYDILVVCKKGIEKIRIHP